MEIFWDLIHNMVAHPLLFLTHWPSAFAKWLHDYSALKADYPDSRADTNDPQPTGHA